MEGVRSKLTLLISHALHPSHSRNPLPKYSGFRAFSPDFPDFWGFSRDFSGFFKPLSILSPRNPSHPPACRLSLERRPLWKGHTFAACGLCTG